MTGTERQVVQPVAAVAATGPAAPVRTAAPKEADLVQLTAIISEGPGKKSTAVVMNGERSMTLDVGDKVAGRKVTKNIK